MYIVDSQVHIWAADTPERPWPPGRHAPHRPVPFTKDDLLREMQAAGVDRAIIIPPGWEGERNDLALEAAYLHPDRLAVMGRFDAGAPGALSHVATWRQQRGMLGMRVTFAGLSEYARPLTEGRLEGLWHEAEKSGVPIMMSVPPACLHLVDRIAERHPGLKIAIDHLARHLGKKDDEAYADLDKLLPLAKRPNVAVKASGLPSHTADVYPYRRLHPYLRRAYDAFGPERMFWGTDLTKLPCSYRQAVTMFTEEVPWFTNEDKEWIMGRGVCEWLGWKLPQHLPPASRGCGPDGSRTAGFSLVFDSVNPVSHTGGYAYAALFCVPAWHGDACCGCGVRPELSEQAHSHLHCSGRKRR